MDYSSNSGSSSSYSSSSETGFMNSTQEFLESNSLIAKFAFLLFILFLFIILFRLGIIILEYFFSSSNNPKIIDGMVDAKQLIVVPQDPSSEGAITINRSVNASEGIEFTWSVWVFIDDLTYNSGKYRCVFYKGNDFMSNPDHQGLNFPNNAPGLYLAPNKNDLIIFMNTYNVINEEVTIEDVPLNKWVNLIIRCENTTLDIYVNGTIVKSHQLHGVPKQNYGNVYIGPNGGFSGYISNLWYYNYGLGIGEISELVAKGPNTTMKGFSSMGIKMPNYLSLRWYFYGNDNSVTM
jgi:hypothetical protein